MRTEGASLFSLLRNLGAAIGVSVATSVMAGNAQAMHEMIGASLTPFNRALQAAGPVTPMARSDDQPWRGATGPDSTQMNKHRYRVCR